MKTKFSNFNKEEYKEIRKFILEFSMEYTANLCFSSFMKNDWDTPSELIDFLEKKINRSFDITLDQFFNEYRDKIYVDTKFIACCGFLDVLLYKYDKNYQLGGDIEPDAMSRYDYGYQNFSLGITYIKQNFGSLNNFYDEITKNMVSYFTPNYCEVVKNIEDCNLIFLHVDNSKYATADYAHWMYIDDDIILFFVGGSRDISELKRKLKNDTDLINDYVDYERIKYNIMMNEDIKKYNI